MDTRKKLWSKIQGLITLNIVITLIVVSATVIVYKYILIPNADKKYEECIKQGGEPSDVLAIFVSCDKEKK